MTFRNPVVGGNNSLVRDAIQSEGFVTGVTGWRIERDGDAEFNDITARGSVVLDGTSTLLVYDDDGVIIAAISPDGGTDPAGSGQTFQPGIDTYASAGGAPTYQVNIRDGFIVFNYVSSTLFKQRGLIQANQPLDDTEGPSLGMYAPSDNTDQRQSAVVCFGTSADGTDEHHVSITGLDPLDGNALIPTTVDINGDVNVSGFDWTDFTPTVYQHADSTPVAISATVNFAQYRQLGSVVWAHADVTVGASTTGGVAIDLPVTAAKRLRNCGTLALMGSGTLPSDQSGVAYMLPDLEKVVLVAFTQGFRDAGGSGQNLRYSICYEGV